MVTWNYGCKSATYMTDTNGEIKIDASQLTAGEHGIQISKTSGKGIPLVLRFAPDDMANVSDRKFLIRSSFGRFLCHSIRFICYLEQRFFRSGSHLENRSVIRDFQSENGRQWCSRDLYCCFLHSCNHLSGFRRKRTKGFRKEIVRSYLTLCHKLEEYQAS